MHFILAHGCIKQFDHLRNDYEKERKVDLEATPSLFGLPTVFGGTDVKTRRLQISLLEKIKLVLDDYLLEENAIKTSQEWLANLMASRIIIATCLYIQAEIGSSKENSALYRLINRYLGVTSENYFDDTDKHCCFHTAYQLFNQHDSLIYMNNKLMSLGQTVLDEEQWDKFTSFLNKENSRKVLPPAPVGKYPVTTFIQPIFEASFSYVGSTIGWVVAETISSSSAAIGPRLQLTGLVSSAFLVIGPAGATGVALLAPTIANRLFKSFCTISLASVSGKAMGLVGKGTGALVGLPFDLAYSLLKSTGSLIINYASASPAHAAIDGVRITDGVVIAQGHALQFNLVPKQIAQPSHLQVTEKGEIFLKNKMLEQNQAMSQVINELNQRFTQEIDVESSLKEEQTSTCSL